MKKDKGSQVLALFGMLLVCFFISLNIAWLNPEPGKNPLKPFDKIPVAWQYNLDVINMIPSVAFFPEYFRRDSTRVNRPLYLAAGYLLGNVIYQPLVRVFHLDPNPKGLFRALKTISVEEGRPMAKLSFQDRSMKVYLLCISSSLFILNGLMILGILFFGYGILEKYFPSVFLLPVLFMIITTEFVLFNAAIIHTNIAHLFSATSLLYLLKRYLESPSLRKIILYSLIAGLLMLAKQNYCNLVLIWLFMLFYKRYKYFLLSFIFHLFPLFLWLGILWLYRIPYINYEAKEYGQGVWFLRGDLFSVLSAIPRSLIGFLSSLVDYYTLPALAFFGLGLWAIRRHRGLFVFSLLALVSAFLQIFVSARADGYMTMDISIIIFGLAWYGFDYISNSYSVIRTRAVSYLICSIWLIYNLLRLANFPLRSPV